MYQNSKELRVNNYEHNFTTYGGRLQMKDTWVTQQRNRWRQQSFQMVNDPFDLPGHYEVNVLVTRWPS